MKQKKLMMLGSLHFLLPVIRAAREQGHYVITCDYLPDGVAHQYSDEHHNISVVDREAILKKARELQIDGIMSFAVDPGVVTAAYVQEQMGLPGNPYESVLILQNKDRFRRFLKDHGFTVPWFKSFDSVEAALAGKAEYPWPVIVKPTDSAGSKGVSRVDRFEQLEAAALYAMSYSLANKIVIEEFIEHIGNPTGSDCFSVDGELKFVSFSAQRFDANAPNPYVPSSHSFPPTMELEQQAELTAELQRLISLLGMKTSLYNLEARIAKNGKPYIMEVSPRGGGNRLAEMLRYSTGVDLIANAIRAAVGDELAGVEQKPYAGHWTVIILHAREKGIFSELAIAPDAAKYVVETDLWVKKGTPVNTFHGADDTIGTLVLRFDDARQLEHYVTGQNEWLKIVLE